MIKLIKDFLKDEDGLGTVEIVVIIAVLVGIALIFRSVIFSFVKSALNKIVGQGNAALDDIDAE
jgi:Flp pilus assembly pilin Flp